MGEPNYAEGNKQCAVRVANEIVELATSRNTSIFSDVVSSFNPFTSHEEEVAKGAKINKAINDQIEEKKNFLIVLGVSDETAGKIVHAADQYAKGKKAGGKIVEGYKKVFDQAVEEARNDINRAWGITVGMNEPTESKIRSLASSVAVSEGNDTAGTTGPSGPMIAANSNNIQTPAAQARQAYEFAMASQSDTRIPGAGGGVVVTPSGNSLGSA